MISSPSQLDLRRVDRVSQADRDRLMSFIRFQWFWVIFCAYLGLNRPALGQTTAPSDPAEPRRGAYQTRFTEQDPRSTTDAQSRRNKLRDEALQHYKLGEESFEVYVPELYDPTQAYGIMVWTSAGDRGTVPRGWKELMDKHRLIFIGANNVGNERGVGVRFGMAMDGVFNLRKEYTIDDSRIYASGNSGGGKIASMLAVMYPEIFAGAIPIVGVSYYRGIPLNDGTNRQWMPNFAAPTTVILDRAKALSRIVLITGSGDMNRDSMKATYSLGYLRDGFRYVDYIEVEGMGHTMPPIDYADRAIERLDKSLPEMTQRMIEIGQQLDRSGKLAEARSLYQGVSLHGDSRLAARATEYMNRIDQTLAPRTARRGQVNSPGDIGPTTLPARTREAEAAAMLSLADTYERGQLYSQAKQRAQRVLQDFPDTKAAATAKEMIRRLDARR